MGFNWNSTRFALIRMPLSPEDLLDLLSDLCDVLLAVLKDVFARSMDVVLLQEAGWEVGGVSCHGNTPTTILAYNYTHM